MSKSKKTTQKTATTTQNIGKVKVLYQFINGQWYAFADMGNEIYFANVNKNVQSVDDKNTTKTKENKEKNAA